MQTYSTTKGPAEGVRPFGPAGKGGGAAGGPQEELRHAHRRADRRQAGRPVDQQGGESFLFSISIHIRGRHSHDVCRAEFGKILNQIL